MQYIGGRRKNGAIKNFSTFPVSDPSFAVCLQCFKSMLHRSASSQTDAQLGKFYFKYSPFLHTFPPYTSPNTTYILHHTAPGVPKRNKLKKRKMSNFSVHKILFLKVLRLKTN